MNMHHVDQGPTWPVDLSQEAENTPERDEHTKELVYLVTSLVPTARHAQLQQENQEGVTWKLAGKYLTLAAAHHNGQLVGWQAQAGYLAPDGNTPASVVENCAWLAAEAEDPELWESVKADLTWLAKGLNHGMSGA